MAISGVAVITGAASGIGRATAIRLAKDGFVVALLDINAKGAAAVVGELCRHGHRAIACTTDITDAAAIAAARDRVLAELGAPTVVVTCAGWSVLADFTATDPAFWRHAIDTNLVGTIATARAFLDDMLAAGGGRIVTIASDAGRVGSSGEAVYSAAKGGVIGFTKALAREMARSGIAVNCVCPGPTITPMLMVQPPKRIEALTRAIPMRRLAEPDDIATAIAFFAHTASPYITGQVLSVSGGLTMAG